MGVIELKQVLDIESIQKQSVEQGDWIRPFFGKLVYLMPRYIISPEELLQLTRAICIAIKKL
ncbi:hypothetical protein [Aquimarina algiphila]|uniref:hypothetical protein n=1 Tax=Aquimarina algiphila TaxID=2047982 RepID=UPI00249369FE|nr:hypothetical protein [Aquimarina algiphila]